MLKMASETSEKFLTRDDILHLSEAERMMKLEMYTGSKKQKPREEWWYNLSKESIEKGIITLPECIERCFMEPLTNASDNVHRSRRWGVKPGHLYVSMSPTRIIVENKGTPIPIEFKEEEGMYVPELIFGVPGSSSHYNESVRHEAGVNGIGAKLTNVFSNRFEVEIDDHIRKKSYKQVWNGMGLEGREDPQIEAYRRKESRVRVTFDLAYDHFGYEDGRAPEETFCLFARHCADISFTTKVPVHFEYTLFEGDEGAKKTIEFELGHPKEYARLYFAEAVENSFLHYEWPKGTKIIKKEDGRQISRDPKIIPLVEMCVIDTPDASENISFVNSMMTRDGGVHVEAALKSVSDHIVNFINADKGDGLTITLKHVRPNISLVLTAMVENPGFSGQTKNKLSDPNPFVPRIKISKEEIQPVMEWSMIQHLLAILEAKKNALLSKSDGKKRRNISTQNGRDANEAGKRKSSQCTLYIVEGLSASSYPKKLIDNMENGRDFCGILPIRGKFLNTRKAKVERIAKNREIAELKKMLGLIEEMDYRDPKNFKTLRYGKVVIMADSDDDGKHIVALLLLYFHCRFPSLLQIGYVYNYLTPIIRVVKGKRSHKFYTHNEYESWKRRNKNFGNWKHIYFKGLGRTTDAQIKEDFHDQHVIHCLYDDYAPETIELAFAKEMGDERKAWLAYFSDAHGEEVVEEAQPISQFLNTELIKFSLLNLRRAIPCMMDGFKDSQRKVMWGAYQIWTTEKVGKIKCGNAIYKEMKVARIAADAAGKTNYHHGERSLENTIVAMAQDFTGSNNLPYFCRDGQFGCVAPDTPILLWNGNTVQAKNIQVGDLLVGDDGEKRTVSHVVSGNDNMYEISQTFGDPYVVNSIHILTLMVPSHKSVFWKESNKSWVMHYLDQGSRKIKSKTIRTSECNNNYPDHYNKSNISKEEAYRQIQLLRDTISDDNVIDIRLGDYIKLSENQKKFFFGFKISSPIKWKKQDVPIDPYILGAWLGDGDYCGRGFTTIDPEIVKKYCLWSNTIGAEIVHHADKGGNTYHFGIRRRGSGYLKAIGDPSHSCSTCPGCQSSRVICEVCDWHPEIFYRDEVKVKGIATNGMKRSDMNPFKEILKEHGLYKNKHIPDVYIQNDEATRLAVLAGLIDTDGTVRQHSSGIGYHVEIAQKEDIHGHILDSAAQIASSLGFKSRIWNSSGMKTLAISDYGLHKIPTLILHKKIPFTSAETLKSNPYVSKIKVKRVDSGSYCGWYIDGNERFLLGDYTVTHNTRDLGGKDAAESRYAETKPEWWIPYVFRREDLPILQLKEDEGEQVEPACFYPILPVVLINGCNGIATAYSTFIANHNPLDVVQWLKCKIQGKALPELKPWYRGFAGSIEVVDRRARKQRRKRKNRTPLLIEEPDGKSKNLPLPSSVPIESTSEEESEDDLPSVPSLSSFVDGEDNENGEGCEKDYNGPSFIKDIQEHVREFKEETGRPLYSMITKGDFYTNEKGQIVITELPIGKWTHPYCKWLESLRDEYKIIKDIRDLSKSNNPGFELSGYKNIPCYKSLRLKTQHGMSNMVLLDIDDKPQRYDSVYDYLEAFYEKRLYYYGERKMYVLSSWSNKITELQERRRFIRAIVTKDLVIENRLREDIYRDMDEMHFPHELASIGVIKFSEDEIVSLDGKIEELQRDIETLESTTPEKLWLRELQDFERQYRKYYKIATKGDKLRLKLKIPKQT